MARDGFIGVKNLHLAPLTDVDALTYETPVAIPGAVQIQASRSLSEEPSYADDEVWINAKSDTGGTGTLSLRDVVSVAAIRALIARLTGYVVTSEGDVLGTDKAPVPCAILCEQSGYLHGRRKLFYYCELSKPDFDASTKEANATVGQIDIPFTFYPIKLAEGVIATTRDSFYGNSTYEDFFEAVVKTTTPASS